MHQSPPFCVHCVQRGHSPPYCVSISPEMFCFETSTQPLQPPTIHSLLPLHWYSLWIWIQIKLLFARVHLHASTSSPSITPLFLSGCQIVATLDSFHLFFCGLDSSMQHLENKNAPWCGARHQRGLLLLAELMQCVSPINGKNWYWLENHQCSWVRYQHGIGCCCCCCQRHRLPLVRDRSIL